MTKILISAGDYSADMHGLALVQSLKNINPTLEVTALGGIKLKAVSDHFLQDMVGLDVSGFSQPIKQFFNLRKILHSQIFPKLEKKEIDAVILIDYYGFNIHIAQKAFEEGIPVFYFVSPQVWASRSGRIKKLKKYVTKMLVIFPFEEELYKKNGVNATFVGNPLVDVLPNSFSHRSYSKANPFEIVLLPGSRVRELKRHIPLMVQTFLELKKSFPNIQGKMIAVDSLQDELYKEIGDTFKFGDTPNLKVSPISLVRDPDYSHRLKAGLALTASGTATLENALLGLPMVVIYKTSWLTHFIAKRLIRVPYISMPNILLEKKCVPEFVQEEANHQTLSRSCGELLSNPNLLESTYLELIKLKKSLGPPGAYARAAKIILDAI